MILKKHISIILFLIHCCVLYATTDSSWSKIYDMVVHTDGTIVATGVLNSNGIHSAQLVRYTPNGILDESFSGGVVSTLIGTATEGNGVRVTANGSIIVGGYCVVDNTNQIALMKFTGSGQPDTSFNQTGNKSIAVGSGCQVNAIELGASDMFYAAGSAVINGKSHFVLLRCKANGTLDSSFNQTGMVTTLIGLGASGEDVRVQADGKIIVAGTALVNNTYCFAAARYQTNGTLDTSFGDGGIKVIALNTFAQARAAVIQSNGSIIIGGHVNQQIALVRLTSTGAVDGSFGSNGTIIYATASKSGINAMTLQPDGKILVAGYSDGSSMLARFSAQGIDSSFGTSGMVRPAFATDAQTYAVVQQPDGKILTGSYANADFSLERFEQQGTFDVTFGVNGVQLGPEGTDEKKATTTFIWDEKPKGQDGGTFAQGNWRSRDLNMISGVMVQVSLNAKKGWFTLQPGIYHLDIKVPAVGVGAHQARLHDLTNNRVVQYGMSAYSQPDKGNREKDDDKGKHKDEGGYSLSIIECRLIVPQTLTFEIQHNGEKTKNKCGFGKAADVGPEIYTTIKIVRE